MLGNPPYDFKTIDKIQAAFAWIFQDISIQRVDPETQVVKTIKVPIEWSAKEKWDERLVADPNAGDTSKQRPINLILPRMAYELKDFRFDPKRKLSPINYRVAQTGKGPVALRQYTPVPMIFFFSLYLQTRNIQDAWSVIGQFIPFFQPDFTISIMDIPEMSLKRDIIFTHVGTTCKDTYEGAMMDKRVIDYQFDFEAKGHLYPPIREKKVITEVDVTVSNYGNPLSAFTEVVSADPPTANIGEPFDIIEESFEGQENVDLNDING